MKLFDLTFTSTLQTGQLIARTEWAGAKWLVWPIDLADPMVILNLSLQTVDGPISWSTIDFDADANSDDWIILS